MPWLFLTDNRDANNGVLWGQNFSYDQYGNRWQTNNYNLPGLTAYTPQTNVYNTATNQVAGQDIHYDAAGNLLSVNGNTAAYDAENHIKSITESTAYGAGTEQIVYDGAGQRVQKTVAGQGSTIYVYDAFGQLAAEYSFLSGTSPCTTCYLSMDQLGSTRMVTDANGNVVVRHDYVPFGEEIPAGYATRDGNWGSTNDSIAQKFTGQTRDSESGLDFFNARYLFTATGRFTSLDPENAGADPSDPQTWNGYSYVRNSPMRFTDPSGGWRSRNLRPIHVRSGGALHEDGEEVAAGKKVRANAKRTEVRPFSCVKRNEHGCYCFQ